MISPLLSKAQYGTDVITSDQETKYIYLGSLPESNSGNLHKLRVDVLGGAWESYSMGETTYYIANRGELKITQGSTGDNVGRFTLHAYHNASNGLDFYLITNNYAAMAVKSCMLGGNSTQLITNTVSVTPPIGVNEITPLAITPLINTTYQNNIGIGTMNIDPNFKLSVNGAIRAKEIKVETGWADYVFDDDYKLPSLSQVQEFIKKNHHLPEVPSAADVKTDGINLGEMNALLLKKLEELTLYLIEQKKEIALQNAHIARLEGTILLKSKARKRK